MTSHRNDEPLPEEDPGIGFAPLWGRLAAFLADAFLFGIVAKVIDAAFHFDAVSSFSVTQAVVSFVLSFAMLAASRHATVGMALVGICATTQDGRSAPSPLQIGLRQLLCSLFLVASVFSAWMVVVGIIAGLWAAVDPHRQTLWDKVARTFVVVDWSSSRFR